MTLLSVTQEDMDNIVSSIIHLANKDYTALVNDFIKLKILPEDCDRPKVLHSESQDTASSLCNVHNCIGEARKRQKSSRRFMSLMAPAESYR